jgi:hypothetical protein
MKVGVTETTNAYRAALSRCFRREMDVVHTAGPALLVISAHGRNTDPAEDVRKKPAKAGPRTTRLRIPPIYRSACNAAMRLRSEATKQLAAPGVAPLDRSPSRS